MSEWFYLNRKSLTRSSFSSAMRKSGYFLDNWCNAYIKHSIKENWKSGVTVVVVAAAAASDSTGGSGKNA